MERPFSRNRRFAFAPVFLFFVFCLVYFRSTSQQSSTTHTWYPYQQTYHKYDSESTEYQIAIISDQDKESKSEENGKSIWVSTMKYGKLIRAADGTYSVEWTSDMILKNKLNEAGRGMELSDLCYFNHSLYSFDDRTGALMQILNGKVFPRNIMLDGDGYMDKGFKGEGVQSKMTCSI